MSFKPLLNRVAVKPVPNESVTKGGIIIPDNAKEKPSIGEVIAVGDGAFDDKGNRIPMSVKVGDKIFYGKWSGTEISLNGDDLLVMKEDDILGIVN